MARISKAELAVEMKSDAVLRYMVTKGIPLTRSKYLSLAYFGAPPSPLGVEQEAELPTFLQNWKIRHAD